jgi:lysophospholipase L1-like esterase
MRFRPIAILAAVVGLLGGTISVGASSEHFNPPKHYYLALGDSLAYGYQQAKFVGEATAGHIDPATFPGYAGNFAAMLRNVRPESQLVNYGCPGETTSTYFTGCYFSAVQHFPLHNAYAGPQEAAALAFLHAHPGQVSPITLDNGANDVTPCLALPDPTNCFLTSIAGVGANLDAALEHLRAAAPNAEIIVMQYYDPFALAFPSSLGASILLNQAIATAAAKHGARLADAFTPFNVSPPAGENLCTLTLICPPLNDEHASDKGYALIAQQFWAASGYSRLGD